jgi:hypothetical protein
MLISPSGGLLYHAKAIRYHSTLWGPFRADIEHWLRFAWNPDRNRPLVLIGPSAGWCLPLAYLREFKSIRAYDPDPLALWFLKRRLKHPSLKVQVQDAIGIRTDPVGAPLRPIIEESKRDGASILFCNLWGQLYLDDGIEELLPRWRRELETLLEGQNWASFFDRVSGPLQPELTPENRWSHGSLKDSEIIERFYRKSNHGESLEIELHDHCTESFFQDLPRLHLKWELQPGRYHLIEALQEGKNITRPACEPAGTRTCSTW